MNVLDNGGRSGGWGGCNGSLVSVNGFEGREGMKKRFVGRRLVVLLLVVVDFILARLVFLETRRCSLGERGITMVEDDNPNLEKRGVTS